jgi:hypothetical protein
MSDRSVGGKKGKFTLKCTTCEQIEIGRALFGATEAEKGVSLPRAEEVAVSNLNEQYVKNQVMHN